MEQTFETLRNLQDILSEKYAIERDIQEIPKALKTKQEILNRLKQSFVEKSEALNEIKSNIKHLSFEMTDAERRREETEKRMDEIKTQREYEALDKEIRDADEKERRFRRDIQRKEAELKEIQGSIELEEKMIAMQEEELAAEEQNIKMETGKKQAYLEELIEREQAIAPGMDEDILFKFQRIIKNKSGVGIVPIKANVCSGCYMVLPAQFVNDIRGGQEIRFCPYCSRVLYWEEGGEPVADTWEFDNEDVGGLSDLIDNEDL